MVAKKKEEFVTGLPENFINPHRKVRTLEDALADAALAPAERHRNRFRRSMRRTPAEIAGAIKTAKRIIGEGTDE